MPHLEFSATQVVVDPRQDALVVTLGQGVESAPPYLTLRRAVGAGVGQVTYSVEINDRSQLCSGGIERAVLGGDYVSLRFDRAATPLLGGITACKVRLPAVDPRFRERADSPFALRGAVRRIFADTTVEVIHALPKPWRGVPRCRLDARERRQLGWHPSASPVWDAVAHCPQCDHMVFLAEDYEDADALGRLGQCVKLTDGCQGRVICLGFPLDNFGAVEDDQAVVLSLSLPAEASDVRDKALDGARLHLNRLGNFDETLDALQHGRQVALPPMKMSEARALQRRLEGWHLVIRLLGL